MTDRFFGIVFFGMALLLCCAVVVGLLSGVIEWLQGGRWQSISLLDAGYEMRLLKARWFITTDWGWRVHEVLDAIPLFLAAILTAPLCWRTGLFFVRR
jgi:hypothetical protein